MPPRAPPPIPEQINYIRVGWKNKEKYSEGLKTKENLKLDRKEAGDSSSKLQKFLDEAKDREDVSDLTVYVRRRHFPIVPVAAVSKKNQDGKTASSSASNTFMGEESTSNINNDNNTNNNNLLSQPSGMMIMEVSENFDKTVTSENVSDIINVISLDEPLPEFHKKETIVDIANSEDYNIPPGARIVGDRVFLPAQPSLFGGKTEETSVPLSFFRKNKEPLFGNSTFGLNNDNPFSFGGGGTKMPDFTWNTTGAAKKATAKAGGGSGIFGEKKEKEPVAAKPPKPGKESSGLFNPFATTTTAATPAFSTFGQPSSSTFTFGNVQAAPAFNFGNAVPAPPSGFLFSSSSAQPSSGLFRTS